MTMLQYETVDTVDTDTVDQLIEENQLSILRGEAPEVKVDRINGNFNKISKATVRGKRAIFGAP